MFGKKKKSANKGSEEVAFLVRSQDIDAIIQLLERPNVRADHAHQALEGLIDLDSADSWTALGRLLSDGSERFVEPIVDRLATMHSPAALQALGDCLSNTNPFARGAAINAIAKNPAPSTMVHLLRGARDPVSSLARRAARVVLRRVERHPNIFADLRDATIEGIMSLMDDRWSMELLSDKFPENVRVIAAKRLGAIGGEDASQALVSVAQRTKGALLEACWTALECCDSVSDFSLLPLLVDPRPEIKARALTLYSRNTDNSAVDLITGLTLDADLRVRKAALSALTYVAPEAALETLESALDDVEEEVRCLAIELLAGIEDSTPELVRVVRTQDGEVRRVALSCLANRGVVTSELVQPYIEFLYKGSSCTDLSQRQYLDSLAVTAKTLGQAQNFEAMLALTALARSVIRRLRRAAIEGLMHYKPEDRADALYSLHDAHDPDIVRNVAFGLHEARDERSVLPLVRAALECRGRHAVQAKEALTNYPIANDVDFLISCLSEKWPSARRYGAEQLRKLCDPKSVPALIEASRDENVEVQLAVFEAMGPFATEHQVVIDRMLEAITLGDISVRQQACEALGEARCEAAVPDLIKALHNFFLRPRATDALKRIGNRQGYLALKRLEIREKLFKKARRGRPSKVKAKAG